MSVVGLRAGALELDLRPDLGGAISGFRLRTPSGPFDLMRPLRVPEGAAPDALYASSFPMVPFANCIRDNRFVHGGRSYTVPANMAGSRLNFHGSGWQSAWKPAALGGTTALLVLPDGRVGETYAYAAMQAFALTGSDLTLAMSVTNRGQAPMPFSFGQHPWFARHGRAQIRFRAEAVWRADAEGQAVSRDAVDAARDFSAWRSPPETYRNDCYAGWTGRADIAWPDHGIGMTMTADPIFAHLMVHVPPDNADVFCLEPQTNAPCAFDALATGTVPPGVVMLAPGETASGRMQWTIRPDAQA